MVYKRSLFSKITGIYDDDNPEYIKIIKANKGKKYSRHRFAKLPWTWDY